MDIPPSIPRIWPVIHCDLSDNKNTVASAMSVAEPIFFNGCRLAFASFFSSLDKSFAAKGVSVNEGAMQLTLIFGANSAAKDLVNPSMAPFETATLL